MRRYRQKKKEKAAPSVHKSAELTGPKSAELSRKKKEAVKRTQAWRMRIKLKESTQQESNSPTDGENGNTGSPGESSSKVLPKATLYRQLKKVKEVLPSTPRSKAAILSKLIESPSTSKVFKKSEMIMTPDCRKKLEMTDTVLQSVSESISEVKTRKLGEKKHAYNIICDSVLKKYKRHRLNKYFKVSVKARKPSSTWWETRQRKRRRDALDSPLKNSVKNFFLSPEISREVPNKRETVKVRKDGQKEILQKHVMTMTLEEAYKEYKLRNPGRKIGLTSFSKLKPVNVKKVSETSRRSCLCQKCCNVALKVEALTTIKKAMKEKGGLDEISIEKKSLSDATFCEYETNPAIKCLRRECQQCGVKFLQNYLKPFIETCSDGQVSWHQWESIEIAKDDKVKRCVSCVPKEADIKTFISCLEKDMQEYPEHIFRATWQQQQMGICVDKIREGSIAMVMDFSENYGCVFQSEVQSGFFDRNQVTIHPMMCYYTEKQEEKEFKVKHAIIGISEETKHDADLAITFENKAIEILEKKGVKVEEIHEWTDGCAAQYKGKKAFADISLRKNPTVTRNYFETSHGKNVCDGLGATVKNACYRAVISNRKVIGCAEDVYDFCTEKLKMENTDNEANTVSRREFILVKDVERNRVETNVQTLQGTRKLHAAKSEGNDYELSIRNLSCYCEQCLNVGGRCNFSEHVNAWEMRKLTLINDKSSQKGHQLKDKNPSTSENKDKVNQKRKQASSQKDQSAATKGKLPKKRKSTERHNIPTKKTKVDNKVPTNREKPLESEKYNPGDFVAVGLKPTKGPLNVYMAEVTDIFGKEVRLKYMRKSGNMYVWPEKDDFSQEALDAILYRVKPPEIVNERGHFKFNAADMSKLKSDLEKNHKHFYLK